MAECCDSSCEDIYTLHAALIHAASEIQFALDYTNGTDPAQITDIGQRNLQTVLESYFSQLGIPVLHERPTGDRGCPGDVIFETDFEFIPGSLQVVLSGIVLNGKQDDPDRDFTELSGNKSFRIELNPAHRERLNFVPGQDETFFVNYRKRITFNTRGGT
jgi:hypothetical protein